MDYYEATVAAKADRGVLECALATLNGAPLIADGGENTVPVCRSTMAPGMHSEPHSHTVNL